MSHEPNHTKAFNTQLQLLSLLARCGGYLYLCLVESFSDLVITDWNSPDR
jgi:hypothetical protein